MTNPEADPSPYSPAALKKVWKQQRMERRQQEIEAQRATNVEMRARMLGSLMNIRYLAMGPESTLPNSGKSMANYSLYRLSAQDSSELGALKAASFRDGLFLSVRLELDGKLRQHDFNLSDGDLLRLKQPSITSWKLNERNGLLIRGDPHGKTHFHDFHHEPTPSIVFATEQLVEKEVASEQPWLHAYTNLDLARAIKKVDGFGISPVRGEPYL